MEENNSSKQNAEELKHEDLDMTDENQDIVELQPSNGDG